MSASVAQKLKRHGIRNVLVPKGGLDNLPKAGFPLYREGDLLIKGKK